MLLANAEIDFELVSLQTTVVFYIFYYNVHLSIQKYMLIEFKSKLIIFLSSLIQILLEPHSGHQQDLRL